VRRALIAGVLATLALAVPAVAAPTFTNPKGTVKVDRNERFDLVFNVTPGTGFSWRISERPDPALVRYVKSVTLGGGREPGSSAQQHLVFHSRGRRGTTAVELAYVGPGRDPEVAQRRTVKIKVRG
jgi:predicted secreted protein